MDSTVQTSSSQKIFAGGLAGASETFVSYPAEFIKTRRQLPEARASSFVSIIRSTYQTTGIRGFYSGCNALATSNTFKSGIRFFSFEVTRDYLDKFFNTRPGQRSPWVNVLAGLSAGVVESVVVVTPGEALKTRLVQDAALGRGRGLGATTTEILKTEGPRALWKGLAPVLCKQGTNSAVRFSTFGILQEKVNATYPGAKGSIGITLLLGAMSGVVTVYASMPFDNVKTRVQSGSRLYSGMLDCANQTLRQEGVLAFWRGTAPRLVRLTLSSAITFVVYDQVINAMRAAHQQPANKRVSLLAQAV